MTDRQPSDFRFVIRQTHASPAADSTSPTVVDTLDDRVVAVFDANDAAVAVSEVLEAAHDVGVALRLTLGQATDPAPLAKVGDVLREAAAGVLANPLPAIGDRGGLGEALLTVLCLERRVVESEPEVAKDLARVRHEIAALRAQLDAVGNARSADNIEADAVAECLQLPHSGVHRQPQPLRLRRELDAEFVAGALGGAHISDLWIQQRAALAALDAVPGDALSRDIGPALDRAHEASGVVTGAPFDEPQNGVKGVE